MEDVIKYPQIMDENDINHIDKHNQLQSSIVLSGNQSQTILCTKFSIDGKYVAAGNLDGSIHCYNRFTGDLAYIMDNKSFHRKAPITVLKFRPEVSSSSKTKNVLVSTDTCGRIIKWHLTSGRPMHTIQEPNSNQIYAFDYAQDASNFATGGKDAIIRIYDESTTQCTLELQRHVSSSIYFQGQSSDICPSGHSNRIYCLKYHPDNSNILLSGGWDNIVYIWDVRASDHKAQRYIISPHICGNDSIDVKGNTIVTASSRNQQEDALELWDFRACSRLAYLNMFDNGYAATWDKSGMVYSAQFSKAPATSKENINPCQTSLVIAAGGGYSGVSFDTNISNDSTSSNLNSSIRHIDFVNDKVKSINEQKNHSNSKLISCIPNKQTRQQNCSISTLDFSPVDSSLAVAIGSDVHIVPW